MQLGGGGRLTSRSTRSMQPGRCPMALPLTVWPSVAPMVRRPERFVTTLTEKPLTYALGRGLDYYDMPSVRQVVRTAERDEYRFQTLILGVVISYPFLNRR